VKTPLWKAVLAIGAAAGGMVLLSSLVHISRDSAVGLPDSSTAIATVSKTESIAATPSESDARFLQAMNERALSAINALHEYEATMIPDHEVGRKPNAPSASKPRESTTLPDLKAKGKPDDQLKQAIRWFESLPKSKPNHKAVDLEKERMAEVGLDLTTKDCRNGICRLSFIYNVWASPHPAQASANMWPHAWSFTTITPDGKIHGHMFTQEHGRQ